MARRRVVPGLAAAEAGCAAIGAAQPEGPAEYSVRLSFRSVRPSFIRARCSAARVPRLPRGTFARYFVSSIAPRMPVGFGRARVVLSMKNRPS